MTMVVTRIANLLKSIERRQTSTFRDMSDMLATHETRLAAIVADAPSGSGIDNGSTLLREACDIDRLVFATAFHHMNEHGFYVGWTQHRVIVTPSLTSVFDLRITGPNRNAIKDYLFDVFYAWLSSEVKE